MQEELNLVKQEEKILKFWQENKIFEKSLKRGTARTRRESKRNDFVFFDGPPFANGLPHYGHILASIIKDVIPRYQTMKGRRVPRRWGWDCHGLPVEFEVEKELGLKTKKDIEKFGIEKFNEVARKSILKYESEWKKIIPRIGRWVDMENAYKTMDVDYMESVLWVFKTLYEKGLVYEGYKSMHLCPRCETTLSNFEVTLNYKEIKDFGVTVKFELKNHCCEATPQRVKSKLKTYLLAWTTTAWTLPGNVALAINPKFEYVKIKINNEYFILAKERLTNLIDRPYEIIEKFKGSKLVGLIYEPLFNYYTTQTNADHTQTNAEKSPHKSTSWKNAFKIYPADFVTLEEGTGIVHIAPAFGAEDMELAQKYQLPFIQHVSLDGKFKNEVKDFSGLTVKPKDDPQSTDRKIIDYLSKNNKLFKQEIIIHSYPHCWRCETPLLNYAASSWFIKVTSVKDKLIKNNQKINWIPNHIKNGRFGKWLEEARDWAISRNRFWGAPLPVWQCQKCKTVKIIGSVEEIKKNVKKSGNQYFVMRHGEAESNLFKIVSSNYKNQHHLTEKGKKTVLQSLKKLKKIDLIFSSDFVRTKETAQLAARYFGIKKIIYDKRLREINTGIFNGKNEKEYHSYFSSLEEKFYKTPPKGENLTQLKNRVAEFLYEIDRKYSHKNILIISHEYPIWLLFAAALSADTKKAINLKGKKPDFVKPGEIKNLNFTPLPHNKNFELDLHRPYIDEVKFSCSCGGLMKRITDVFDCWFESGSMPYGQAHYPFAFASNQQPTTNNQQPISLLNKMGFPAEFIAEGIDQTRGWFYTLLVLSTALFNRPAFKNVIVNGIILAEDGQKMSKRLKNYPDPIEVINKYGADALRLYLLSAPVVAGENLNFSEKGVDEIYKKVILRLWNVYKFYDLYADKKQIAKRKVLSANVLDQWILARLEEVKANISKSLEKYELDKAVRPIIDFIDDLSTWYIRRSRERFTGRRITQTERGLTQKKLEQDKNNAIATTKFVLEEFSKIIAPFTPFIAEIVYQQLTTNNQQQRMNSVHLQDWPKFNSKLKTQNSKLLSLMAEIRKIASLALEARAAAGIKVRQPLQKLKIKNLKFKINENLLNILRDEINVKEIIFDPKIKNEVELDKKITPELKAEGQLRELVRLIQDLRKKAGYLPKDQIYLWLEVPEEIEFVVNKYFNDFKEKVGVRKIEFQRSEKSDASEETKIDNRTIWLGIKKYDH
jgi:isoleucyl-tRNA synthetase